MHVSRLMVRWYKSFNTLSLSAAEHDRFADARWTKVDKESFPFVHIALDPEITTIVGSNEAGKSHLLSAIAKAFNAESPTAKLDVMSSYDRQDICRYCGFNHLETVHWPQFVIELKAESDAERTKLAVLAKDSDGQTRAELWVLIDGSSDKQYAQVFTSPKSEPVERLTRASWIALAKRDLPEVRFIAADKGLANEVHVNQLLDLYAAKKPGPAYDPLQLQRVADSLRVLANSATKPATDTDPLAEFRKASAELDSMKIGPTEYGQLETYLFRDVLEVPLSVLTEIHELSSSNQPYIHRIVTDIQNRIDERLDLSRVWLQDPDLRLTVDYSGGIFQFRITDRTNINYTFDERSSGLRFFLAYYIQALALEHTAGNRGMLILMDEPDGFLSAAGQRNLLKVFENLVDRRRNEIRTQLIYTTHSPFLINRNFPGRIRLVRKGDGAEGTQAVERSAAKRFEPVRTALGIDYADTLFVGSSNIVVEGPSDQRLLVAGIQRFGRNSKADATLDLNQVSFVTAGGTTRMKKVIERSIGGTDDKLPVAVALLDGDAAGSRAFEEIKASGLLHKNYLILIDLIGIVNPVVARVQVLEDLIPVRLLASSCVRQLAFREASEMSEDQVLKVLSDEGSGINMADRLKLIHKSEGLFEKTGIEQDEFRASVIEDFCEWLMGDTPADKVVEIAALETNLRLVYKALAKALDLANLDSSQKMIKKRITYQVKEFRKSHQTSATVADVRRYLEILGHECRGGEPELMKARTKIESMVAELSLIPDGADASVDRSYWVRKLEGFASTPWS